MSRWTDDHDNVRNEKKRWTDGVSLKLENFCYHAIKNLGCAVWHNWQRHAHFCELRASQKCHVGYWRPGGGPLYGNALWMSIMFLTSDPLQPSISLLEERPSKAFITTSCINVYVVVILFVYFGDSISGSLGWPWTLDLSCLPPECWNCRRASPHLDVN